MSDANIANTAPGEPRPPKSRRNPSAARTAAYCAMLCAAAMLFSYAESLIPIGIVPIPGFKIGFANIAIMAVVYRFGGKYALLVNAVRSILTAMLFGGLTSAIFSLGGGTLAVLAMTAVKRLRCFSIYSVGIAGAAAHNIGQLIAASVILKTAAVFAYLPWLMICSLICGVLIAMLTALCLNAFTRITEKVRL